MGAGSSHPDGSSHVSEDYKEELIRLRLGEGAMGKETPAFVARAANRSPRLECEWATSTTAAAEEETHSVEGIRDKEGHGSMSPEVMSCL